MKKYLKAISRVLLQLIIAYPLWILRYSNHPERYPLELRFAKVQKLIRRICYAFDIKIDYEDVKNFYKKRKDDSNVLIVSNHLSDMDPIIYIAIAERPLTFVSKIETLKMPFVGRIVKILDGEFMNRSDLKQSFKIMENVKKKLEDKNTKLDIIIFPEGTRFKGQDINKRTLAYHYGSFRPAKQANSSVYAFALYGTQGILSPKVDKNYFYVKIEQTGFVDFNDNKEISTQEVAKKIEKETNDKLLPMMKANKRLMS